METPKAFNIESYRSYDLNALVELASDTYKTGSILNKDYLNWQYNQNPFGKCLISVAIDELSKDLVGQYIVVPYEYVIDGDVFTGTLSLNTLTRSDFRGRGLFTKLANSTYKECEKEKLLFTVGFPNQMSFGGFVKKLKFTSLGDVPLVIYPLSPIKLLINKLFKKQIKHGGQLNLELNDFKRLDYSGDLDAYNTFWENYKNRSGVMLNRTFSYLDWRYSKLPTRKYTSLKIESNGEIVGIIVLKGENVLASKTVVIMDLMLLENIDLEKDYGVFLKNLKVGLKREGFELIAGLTNKSTFEYKILSKANFFKVPEKLLPQPIPFILRLNQNFSKDSYISDLINWKISFGDYDIF